MLQMFGLVVKSVSVLLLTRLIILHSVNFRLCEVMVMMQIMGFLQAIKGDLN